MTMNSNCWVREFPVTYMGFEQGLFECAAQTYTDTKQFWCNIN